jgi:hypothetical protein
LPPFQIGKEIISNSAKDIEYEKKRMEYVLEKQKRLQVSNFKNVYYPKRLQVVI